MPTNSFEASILFTTVSGVANTIISPAPIVGIKAKKPGIGDFSLKTAIENLNALVKKAASDEGSLGKLINDKTLYNNLNNSLKSANTLLDDLRVHPKRYVQFSVFGKKDKASPLLAPIIDTASTIKQ
jgi:hypothetical protein